MRRRDLLRALGMLGMSSVPLTACVGASARAATTRSASLPPAVPATADPPATTARASTQAIGGRLVQAAVHRHSPPTAESVRNTLLPVSAALYRAALPGDDNAVISPYSIVAALGMLALGARGVTARQLTAVLGGDAGTVARRVTGVDAELARAVVASTTASFGAPPSPVVIEPANAVFVRPSAGVQPQYLDELATGYGAGVREVDFAAPAAAIATMNSWVGQRTHGLIPHLMPPDFVDATTLLVLVNALYLKAAWANPFDPGTSPQPFTTPSRTVRVPFMTRTGGMSYAAGPKWRAVSIPLVTDLAMTVILPRVGAFRQVSAGVDAQLLSAAMNGEDRTVELAMPAFTTDVQTDLKPPLTAMGLDELFTTPDLSGIAAGAWVSGAVHQARIVVDDKGIEAAAATAIAIPASGLPPEAPFRVDRPFLYVVHDVQTGTPLFLGRVTDPTR